MGITTHILDTTRGRPATGVAVTLEHQQDGAFVAMGAGQTDDDGRLKTLLPAGTNPSPGVYRISFAVNAYFHRINVEAFYPQVSITFRVTAPGEHYHVPLLLNPFGFSTYRGS